MTTDPEEDRLINSTRDLIRAALRHFAPPSPAPVEMTEEQRGEIGRIMAKEFIIAPYGVDNRHWLTILDAALVYMRENNLIATPQWSNKEIEKLASALSGTRLTAVPRLVASEITRFARAVLSGDKSMIGGGK